MPGQALEVMIRPTLMNDLRLFPVLRCCEMPGLPQMPLPPVSAECETTLHLAQAGTSPKQIQWKLFRSSDGKTRIDRGDTSVIANPASQQTIMLHHLKKEARLLPAPPASPAQLSLSGMPNLGQPVPPLAAPINTQDLGKRFVQGQEVEGKRYILPAVQAPKLPGLPQIPGVKTPDLPKPPTLAKPPALPGAPSLPRIPATPKLPPTTVEVWTSTKLQVPMLSKVTGGFGHQTDVCKSAVPGEPSPALFQIPAGYKSVGIPAPPKPPGLPS